MTYEVPYITICKDLQRFVRKTPFLHEFVGKRLLTKAAQIAEHLRLRGQHACQQKEAFEQLLFVVEGDRQELPVTPSDFVESLLAGRDLLKVVEP